MSGEVRGNFKEAFAAPVDQVQVDVNERFTASGGDQCSTINSCLNNDTRLWTKLPGCTAEVRLKDWCYAGNDLSLTEPSRQFGIFHSRKIKVVEVGCSPLCRQ